MTQKKPYTHKCRNRRSIGNCIHTYAGIQLRAECNRQMNQLRIRYGRDYEQPTAVPMLTDGYNLPAKKVIHNNKARKPVTSVIGRNRLFRVLS